ncbi:MAG: Sua5/YciO/YrdC/YwlC family protein [Phycisphaerales bacterium]
MPDVVQLPSLTSAERTRLSERAAGLLRTGGLILLPTETVYGLACSAADANALGKLAALSPKVKRTISPKGVSVNGFTWHAPDSELVVRAAAIAQPVHLRALMKLAPGPVRIVVEKAHSGSIAGEIAGAFLTDGALSVRVPDHDFTREVLRLAGVPVAMDRAPASVSSEGRRIDSTEPENDLRAMGVELCIDDGATRFGTISSTLRLTSAGGYRVEAEGALSAKAIDDAMELHVLFVCSGNTCRSPMAERIAIDALEHAPMTAQRVRIASAGTGAGEGEPATPEGDEALRRLGVRFAGRHRSRLLTRDMIRAADFVYAMTRSHRDAVLSIEPDAAEKVLQLDEKSDIPDPIGSGLDAYVRTAERIRAGILKRFAEIHLLPESSRSSLTRAAGEQP